MKFRNIGDVLLTSPMASGLATLSDKPEVTFLVKKGTEEMLTGHPDIHSVLTLPEKKNGEKKIAFLLRQLAFIKTIRSQHFDISINTTEGDRGLILGWLSGAKRRIGYLKKQEKWWRKQLVTEPYTERQGKFHTVLRNLDLIRSLITPTDIQVSFHFTAQDKQAVIEKLKQAGWDGKQPLIHVHPVSRWFFKCWRDDYMAQLIDHLQQELNYQIVLTSAPDTRELGKLADIITLCQTQPINLGGQLSLKQMGSLSALAKLFFGVDSAPMHIAAAVDTPVVAIFGPSGAFDWGPWPNGWTQINNNPDFGDRGISNIRKHSVIRHDLECVPCGQAGCNNTKISKCLNNLYPNIIIGTITSLLK
jgi:heptosyltransferase-3